MWGCSTDTNFPRRPHKFKLKNGESNNNTHMKMLQRGEQTKADLEYLPSREN